MSERRYRAPQKDGELLLDPPGAAIGPLLAANHQQLLDPAIAIDGAALPEFRREARTEILAEARRYLAEAGEPMPPFADGPLLLSGHQPELIHPGVWIKNFALHQLARNHNLVPLSLVVDTDTVKSTSVRLPVLPLATAHLEAVPFDEFSGESAYEDRPIRDPQLFDSFADRTGPMVRTWGYRPLLADVWPDFVRQRERTPLLGEILASTRRGQERLWGCHNYELPISRMCATRSFRRFVRQIVHDLPRFHGIYNECVERYREAHGVRSRNHPVPNLARDGAKYELPFWIMSRGKERRGRCFATPGEEIAPEAALRTRALTTTMFARVCLAESFIHGIGGGLYDEVTDRILDRWLGLNPPRIIVMSGTCRLPLPRFPNGARYHRAVHEHRDLFWNPQRHLAAGVEADSRAPHWLERKRRLIASKPDGKAARKTWFRELQEVTAQLRSCLGDQLSLAEQALLQSGMEQGANEVVMRRDFAWILFPEESLRPWLTGIAL